MRSAKSGSGSFAPLIGALRILFQNGSGAKGKDQRVFHAAHQVEAHAVAALLAPRKTSVAHEGGIVHEAMRVVLNAVDTADGHKFARLECQLLCRPRFGHKEVVQSGDQWSGDITIDAHTDSRTKGAGY